MVKFTETNRVVATIEEYSTLNIGIF